MLKKSSRMLTVNIVIVRGGSRNSGEGGGGFFFKGMGSGGRLPHWVPGSFLNFSDFSHIIIPHI